MEREGNLRVEFETGSGHEGLNSGPSFLHSFVERDLFLKSRQFLKSKLNKDIYYP